MTKRAQKFFRWLPIAAACAAGPALATSGYFPHGYGMTAKSMGGAAAALVHDSMGGATNPASMVWVGNRIDIGADLFMPDRDAERTGSALTLNGRVESGKKAFVIPEFGYNRMIDNNLSLGVTVYGNGGMNTTYPQGNFNCGAGPANMLCGSGKLGVDLIQLIVAPTIAYKLNENHAVGASLLIGHQRFKAYGLQAFTAFSSDPASVTNNGTSTSNGFGLRLGYQGRLSETVSVGAAYAPKMNMSAFSKYKGLFAGGGDFDIPSHYNVGIAVTPTPKLTLAMDLGRVNYGDVPSVGNPSASAALLGTPNGPGFGWRNISFVRVGAAWKMSEALTLRAGYYQGGQPITAADVTFNIVAPGVPTKHYTGGFSYAMDKDNEITGMLMITPRGRVTGASLFFGGTESISMRQLGIGVSWGRKF